MEELQDAIEDAQYVSAISSVDDGPRPVLPWDIPEEEELKSWKEGVISKSKITKDDNENSTTITPFDYEWTLAHALGFFLFSSYLKDSVGDHVEINFMEEVVRWRGTSGRFRAEKTSFIISNYLAPLSESDIAASAANAKNTAECAARSIDATVEIGEGDVGTTADTSKDATVEIGEGDVGTTADTSKVVDDENDSKPTISTSAKIAPFPLSGPPKTEINEYDLAREPASFTSAEMQEMRSDSSDPTKTCIGVGGQVLDTILTKVDKLRKAPGYKSLPDHVQDEAENDVNNNEEENGVAQLLETKSENGNSDKKKKEEPLINSRSLRNLSLVSNELPEDLFDKAEAIVAENVRDKHWAGFQRSEYHAKLLNFLWFQDRKVVEEDFFVMRVLGRGGFGLVTGKCFCVLSCVLLHTPH